MKLEKGKTLELKDLGRIDYGVAHDLQKQFIKERLLTKGIDQLILVEHPPVITIGRSGDHGDLRISEAGLYNMGLSLFETNRGGRATYHGPGQMVAYPIIKFCEIDLHWYVQTLLKAVADVLMEYGLKPMFKDDQPGIWVAGKKITSIGIAVKKGITSHGVALNVAMDLNPFQWIIPCGHSQEVMTSMEKELGCPVDLEAVKKCFLVKFCKRFGYDIPLSEFSQWEKTIKNFVWVRESRNSLRMDTRW